MSDHLSATPETQAAILASAPELRQVRDLTQAECGAALYHWNFLLRTKVGADKLYGMAVTALYGFLAFLLIALYSAVNALEAVNADLALQLSAAAIGCAICVALVQWRSRKAQAKYLDQFRAGDRYRMNADGLLREVSGGFGQIGWRNIAGIILDRQQLTILTDRAGAIILTKAAFGGQDVEGFATELHRRWTAARTAAQAAE